jgi:hypothetical protein
MKPTRKKTKSIDSDGVKHKLKEVTRRNGVTKSKASSFDKGTGITKTTKKKTNKKGKTTTTKKKTYSNPRRAAIGGIIGGVAATAAFPPAGGLGIIAGMGVGSLIKKRLNKTKK